MISSRSALTTERRLDMLGADGSISAPTEVPCLDKCELEAISLDAALHSTDPDAESCDSSAEWDSEERDSTFGSYSSGLSLDSQECWVDKQVETAAAPLLRPPVQKENYEAALAADRKCVWHHMHNHETGGEPLMIVRGRGLKVWDAHGNEYLDGAAGGVWTVNVGYGRVEVADAVRDQLLELNFFQPNASNVPAAVFAEKLLTKMPGMSRVFYSSSGSEANEKAFKMVRLIAQHKYGGRKNKILFRERDYHGTTFGALSATGQPQRRQHFGPFLPGFIPVPHNCEYRSQWGEVSDYGVRAANEIEKVILREGPETVGAICLECITAGGGAILPPTGYWPRVQEICKKYQILLHMDEVVMGMGRTGKWFGYQQFDIKPDIVTMAKGLASGYAAVSVTVTTENVFNMCHDTNDLDAESKMVYFRDISTYAACTAGPTAALACMEIAERENLVENAATVGAYLQDKLRMLKDKHQIVGDVRGMGLFGGLELVRCRKTKEPVDESVIIAVQNECRDMGGVLIGRTNRSFAEFNNTLLIAPALIASTGDIDVIISALDGALSRI